jgi:hypothetical protein
MPIDWFQPRRILKANASLYEKKLSKIYLKFEKLALKGKSYWIEFYNLVDELVEKGDYGAMTDSVYYYYGIDLTEEPTLGGAKKKMWDEILFQTQNNFLIKLKRLYDQKFVYQISHNIFSSDNNKISLVLSNPLTTTFSSTGLTQSFTIFRDDDLIKMNVLNPSLYSVSIDRAVWVTESNIFQPTRTEEVQEFYLGTYSGFKSPTQSISLDIPTSVVREYYISTEEKQNILPEYTYSESFLSTTSTASITWLTSTYSNGYILNISTASGPVDQYTSVRYGNVPTTNYDISSLTASLYLMSLNPNQTYNWTIRDSLTSSIYSITTIGTTSSLQWESVAGADAYSLDVSTYSSFSFILPGLNLILGTISNTSSYVTGVTNSYMVSGLTSGVTYYYKARALKGNTQSGSFVPSQTFGTAKWPINSEATAYYFELSKSINFNTIEKKVKLGTQSSPGLTFSGLTASYTLSNLNSNSTYYYRINVYRGYNRTLNYRFALLRDTLLGQIYEVDILSPDVEYYSRNKEYARIQGLRKTYLEVYKRDDASPTGFSTIPLILAYDNLALTEDQNLLIRYSQACDYLNSLV